MKEREDVEGAAQRAIEVREEGAREAYAAPRLTVYGTVGEITEEAGTNPTDGLSGSLPIG